MAVTTDIVATWRGPRTVMRRHLARERSEPWLFAVLVTFLVLVFISQMPVAARASFLQPEVPIEQRLLALGLGLLATIPVWYGLAALSHVVARVMGGQGDYYGARLALFWALVTVAPLMLFQGLLAGLNGPSPALNLVGIATAVLFLAFWLTNLSLAEA